MSLLDTYKERNADPSWKIEFSRLAEGKSGRVFKYFNTNFRTQKSFVSQFSRFERVENVSRDEWHTGGHGQESDKQRVVKLLEAQLFQRVKHIDATTNQEELLYKKTGKGQSYKKYISKFRNANQNANRNWIINYFYLLNGNYGNEKNHIVETTKKILGVSRMLEICERNLYQFLIGAIHTKNNDGNNTRKLVSLMNNEFFYIMSFYNDIEFLEIYFKSNVQAREELHNYITDNWQARNTACCISEKYKSGGSYSYLQALDEIKVFYLTYMLLSIKTTHIRSVFKNLLTKYVRNFPTNQKIVFDYLMEESETFFVILEEALEIEHETTEYFGEDHQIEDAPIPYIDVTVRTEQRKADKLFSQKKKGARKLADYKCALEQSRNCNNHYFTSKKTNEPYVEVHHLIPREYSIRFEFSIEVFTNYVVLCPNCHQLLHKAVDTERKDHVNYLFNARKDSLSNLGLKLSIEELYEFYRIEI